jgi:DNA-binding transcriptional LysR family regulator
MGTGSFPGVKTGRGVTLTPHSLLEPWSRKSRAIPLLPLWAVQLVQSFSACARVHSNIGRPRKNGGTIFILRVKEQETRLTLHKHNEYDDDEEKCVVWVQ